MSKSILLSRSARFCAGRVPLALLLQKLARLGETAAIRALHELPLSPKSRVRWVPEEEVINRDIRVWDTVIVSTQSDGGIEIVRVVLEERPPMSLPWRKRGKV